MLQLIDLFETTLSGAYTAGGASLALTSTAGLPATGDYWLSVYDPANAAVSYEVMKVTGAPSGGAVPVTGAQAGTTAKNHAAGQIAYASVLTAAALAQLKADAVVGLVPDTRSILSGTGLTGGGNLTADRTLSVVADTTNQRLKISSGGTLTGTRPQLNLIQGANVTLTVADDSTNNRVNVTVAAASGSGSQTPWTSDINAANFKLNSVKSIGVGIAAQADGSITVLSPATTAAGITVAQLTTTARAQLLTQNDLSHNMSFGIGGSADSVVPDFGFVASNVDFVFATGPSQTIGVRMSGTKMRIGGTTAPAYSVDVTGDVNVTGAFRVNGTPISTGSQTPWTSDINAAGFQLTSAGGIGATSALILKTASAERMRIDSGGNVGIGTAVPRSQLSIVPAVSPTSPATATQITICESSNTAGYHLQLGLMYDGAQKGVIQSLAAGAGGNLLLNPLGGNVGIGTTAPLTRLDTVDVSQLYNAPAGGAGSLRVAAAAGINSDALFMGSHTGDYSWIQAVAPGVANRNLILNGMGGNVGIGTATPRGPLSIVPQSSTPPSSTANQITVCDWTNNSAYGLRIGYYNDAGNLGSILQSTAASAGAPLLLNPSGGNVGIGTTTPGYALDVTGDVNCSGNFRKNGVAIGGSQTPWTQNIDGGGFSVSNVLKYAGTSAVSSSPACIQTSENLGGVSAGQPVQSITFNVNTSTGALYFYVRYANGTTKFSQAFTLS